MRKEEFDDLMLQIITNVMEEKHEKRSESGPGGSVRAHIRPGWILPGLGSLWDPSRTQKLPKTPKNIGFQVCPYFSQFFPIALSSLTAAGQHLRCLLH